MKEEEEGEIRGDREEVEEEEKKEEKGRANKGVDEVNVMNSLWQRARNIREDKVKYYCVGVVSTETCQRGGGRGGGV